MDDPLLYRVMATAIVTSISSVFWAWVDRRQRKHFSPDSIWLQNPFILAGRAMWQCLRLSLIVIARLPLLAKRLAIHLLAILSRGRPT